MTRRTVWLILLLLGCITGPMLFAQVAQSTGNPLVPSDANEWGSSAVLGILSSMAMEWWKRSPFGVGLSEKTTFWNQRWIGIALAIAGAMGISFHFDPTAGVFTIAGLTLPSIWTLGTHALRQFLFNEYIYRSGVKNGHTT